MAEYKWFRCDGCNAPVVHRNAQSFTFTSLDEFGQKYRHPILVCNNCVVAMGKYDVFKTCRECNSSYAIKDFLTPGGICKPCHKIFKEQTGIRAYNTNVLNLLEEPLSEKKLLLGVELEIEAPIEASLKATRFLGLIGTDFAIAKEDGSVRGFEVVTIPATLHTHAKRWEFLRNRQELPKGLKGWSGTTNGMHIHVSRDVLPLSMLPKYRYFVHSESNRQFIYNIAGRRSDTWANVTYIPNLGRKKQDGPNRFIRPAKNYNMIDKNSLIELGTGKYSAVNQHRSGKTFEFRIFRSTLSYDRIMTDLEFVHALTNYLLQVPLLDLSKYHWTEFVKWVQNSEYKKLKRFFNKERHIGVNYQFRDGSIVSGAAIDDLYNDTESAIHTTQDEYHCGNDNCVVCNNRQLGTITYQRVSPVTARVER